VGQASEALALPPVSFTVDPDAYDRYMGRYSVLLAPQEQLRRQLARERLDLACELALLNGQCRDAPGESAQREQRPAQLRVLTAFRTDRREPAQELRASQRAELSA